MMKSFVGAAALVAADAATLKLTWSDCGGAHVKITGFTPATVTTGQKTKMTGTGNLDEDVSAANFDLEMKTAAGTVSCKGDAGTSKTCNLPLGTGSLTFNAMSFPIKKGSTAVSVDLSLSAALPGALARTDTKVTATATNGDGLFCMEIKTAPAEGELVASPTVDCKLNPPSGSPNMTIVDFTIHDLDSTCCDTVKASIKKNATDKPPACVVSKSFSETVSMNGGPVTGDACNVSNLIPHMPAKGIKFSDIEFYGLSSECCAFQKKPAPPVPADCPPAKTGFGEKLTGVFTDGTAWMVAPMVGQVSVPVVV